MCLSVHTCIPLCTDKNCPWSRTVHSYVTSFTWNFDRKNTTQRCIQYRSSKVANCSITQCLFRITMPYHESYCSIEYPIS